MKEELKKSRKIEIHGSKLSLYRNGLFWLKVRTYPLNLALYWTCYMRAYFWSPYLWHITRSTCISIWMVNAAQEIKYLSFQIKCFFNCWILIEKTALYIAKIMKHLCQYWLVKWIAWLMTSILCPISVLANKTAKTSNYRYHLLFTRVLENIIRECQN